MEVMCASYAASTYGRINSFATGYEFSGVDAPKNDKDIYGLRYGQFVVPLVTAMQELNSMNKKLESENENLYLQIKDLEVFILSMQSELVKRGLDLRDK